VGGEERVGGKEEGRKERKKKGRRIISKDVKLAW
jgi:hypothetical protein